VLYGAAVRTVPPSESDFPAFYSATRLWQQGLNPYDLEKQCDTQLPIRGVPCLPFAHPPVLIPLVALVSNADFTSSYYRWIIVLVAVGLLCIIPLYNLSRDLRRSIQSILFLPLVLAVALGQDTPFVTLAVLLWCWLIIERKDILAGLALSLAVVKPQIALFLAIPLLFSRPKAFFGFCLGGLGLVALSYALVGNEGFRGLVQIVRLMSHGQGFGVNSLAMVSVTGLLVRAGLSPLWSWLFFFAGIIVFSLVFRKTDVSFHAILLGVIVAIFCAPHLHFHDLSLLCLPILFLHPLAPALVSIVLGFAYVFYWHLSVAYGLLFFMSLFQMTVLRKRGRFSQRDTSVVLKTPEH
jgi:hypothetical protein